MRDLLNKLTLFESTNEGNDAIIFKGKEIDPDTIEYDMQDFSDMIAPIESAKYTDGTEVDEEDFEELDQLPAMIDWISTDYMDRQADQADMYRDAQAHGDFESMSEDELPKITDEMNGMISDLVEKFSRFRGGNGDRLPDGYIQWALNSGITTDFVEENEAEAMREKYGEEEFENDPLGHVDEMPITKAFMDEIEKITGDDDIDTNARMIDKVQSGDADESVSVKATEDKNKPGQGALDKFRELHRKSIGSNDDEVVLKELIEVINDDSLFADEFTALRAFTSASQYDDSEIVTVQDIPGNTPDEKIETLLKAIDDDEWVESFAEMLMKDFSMGENTNQELNRIKELSGMDTIEEEEQTFEGEEFYEYYGYLPWHEDIVDEAEYQGRKVKLGKPMQGDVKKFKVYVRDPKTKNVKKVNFGDPNMRIKKSNPKRRKSFRARHNCDNPGPRTKARYWSCRKW